MVQTINSAPLPVNDPIARPRRPNLNPDPLEGLVSDAWVEWFTRLNLVTNAAPGRVNPASAVTAQTASIATTDISGGALGAGLYRISYYARITTAAGTSSSLTVTLGWTESGVALGLAGTAMTGNTVTTVQSGTALLMVDSATPITYATTYASVGAPAMQYRLSVVLEQVQA